MTVLRTALVVGLVLGALALSGVAFAAPSITCEDANNGSLDIIGALPGIQTGTRPVFVGEIYTATLSGSVSNSFLEFNGTSLFNGQTSGSQSYTTTATALTIRVDLQGTSPKLSFHCTEAPAAPIGGGTAPAPSPAPNIADITRAVTFFNAPLGDDYPLGGIEPDDPFSPVFDSLMTSPFCPEAREKRMAQLVAEIADLRQQLSRAAEKASSIQFRIDGYNSELFRAGLRFDPMLANHLVEEEKRASQELDGVQRDVRTLQGQYAAAVRDLEALSECAAAPSASQFVATPMADAADPMSAPFAAFGPSGTIGGTRLLLSEEGIRAWASGHVSWTGGSAAAIASTKGSLAIGGAIRVTETMAVAGQIGLAGGRTVIGSANTTADFVALNAMIAGSHRLAEKVRLDLSLAGGLASNQINIAGATGSFVSAEIGGTASLAGEMQMGVLTVAPTGTLSASYVASSAYVLSNATAVAATGTAELSASGGIKVSRMIDMIEQDLIVTPYVAVNAGYLASSASTISVAPGSSLALSGLFGTLSAGIDATHLDGMRINLKGSLSGHSSSVLSVGLGAGIGGTF